MKIERLLGADKEYWVFTDRGMHTHMYSTDKYPKVSFALDAFIEERATEYKFQCIRDIALPLSLVEYEEDMNAYYYVFSEEVREHGDWFNKSYYLHEKSGEYFVISEIME